jgi:hypothetical protein
MKTLPLVFISGMLVIGSAIEITAFHSLLWQTKLPMAIALIVAWSRKDPDAS